MVSPLLSGWVHLKRIFALCKSANIWTNVCKYVDSISVSRYSKKLIMGDHAITYFQSERLRIFLSLWLHIGHVNGFPAATS